MKTTGLYIIMGLFGLLLMTGCSKSTSGVEDETDDLFNGTSKISGVVVAPDGSTPISGATVYVPNNSGSAFFGGVVIMSESAGTSGATCEEPSKPYAAKTCTEANGSFQFDVPVKSGVLDLNVEKGVFSFSTRVEIGGSTANIGNVTMPSDGDNFTTKIAVITGEYDRMQDILAKLGLGTVDENGHLVLGTEVFDLYDGDYTLPEGYPFYTTLMEDADMSGQPDLFNYDIVFVNCGVDEYALAGTVSGQTPRTHSRSSKLVETNTQNTSPQFDEYIAAIQQYVQNGGVLYVTDWAYDFIEQPFPSKIDFFSSDDVPENEPEYIDEAEWGVVDITTDADILEPNLGNWLGNVSCESGNCLNTNETIHIEGFLDDWIVMNGAHTGSDVKFWVEGLVEWYDYVDFNIKHSGVKPLTASFVVGSGKVVFSSYHTVEEVGGKGWKPQERILQYLIFE